MKNNGRKGKNYNLVTSAPLKMMEAYGSDPYRSQARVIFALKVNELAYRKSTTRNASNVSAAARAFIEVAAAASHSAALTAP